MKRTKFYACFRCGQRSFEYLQTYGHCVNCLYFTLKEDAK